MIKAAALVAAAAITLAVACGDGEGTPPSSSPTSSASPSPTAPASTELPAPTATPPQDSPPAGAIDLARDTPLLRVLGAEPMDLATGSRNVALADFNGDGDTDLLVGAPQADGPAGRRPDAGHAYVIFGPLRGDVDLLTDRADVTIYGQSPGDNLGFAVLAADLNGDGADDIIVGAPGVTAGFDPRTDQGRAYVFFGGSHLRRGAEFDLAEDVFDFTVTGAEGFSRLGHTLESGDVNGDGLADLVVGAPFAGREPGSPPGSPRTAVGEVYVIFGSARLAGEMNVARLEYDALLSGSEAFGQFGASIAVGDLNGDGLSDLAVAAHRSSTGDGREGAGAVYVFAGSRNLSGRLSVEDGAQEFTVLGPAAGAGLGLPLAIGDFNGDGHADLAVGSQTEALPGEDTGRGAIRVLFAGSGLGRDVDLRDESADVTIPGPAPGLLFPSSMAVLPREGPNLLFTGLQLGAHDPTRVGAGVLYRIQIGSDSGPEIDPADLPLAAVGRPADRLGGALTVGPVRDGRAPVAVLAAGTDAADNRPDTGAIYVLMQEAP